MGQNASCFKGGELDVLEFCHSHRLSVVSLASNASSASNCSEDDINNRSCGFLGNQELKRFQWVPPKGWDHHARLLRVSARNSLIWDGSTPVPVAPAKSLSWLLPCSDKMALRIAKLQEKLRSSGWKIVTSPVHIIQSLGNKAQFPVYAAKIGMLSFLPCHFSSPEMAAYPCVLKPAKGEYGKNTYICHSKEEVYQVSPEFSTAKWVLQELVPGNVEFSVSLLVLHGSIVDVIGMKYVYDKSIYIWPKVTELHRHLCGVPVQHTAVMARFLAEYDGIVNFNYKQRPDGRICIFEVNTRIGADLACDAPRERARELFQLLDKLRG